jgi:molybdopterin molybdotransferase
MISVDQAFEHYAHQISPLPLVELPLDQALWRVAAQDILARIDLPPFPQSAMDGYTLRAGDTTNANPERPVRLRLAGEIPAGRRFKIPQLKQGEAMRIFTGGYVPQGADAILRQEEAHVEDGWLLVRNVLPVGTNLRVRGEEIPKGERLAAKGTRLIPGHLAAFAIAGVERVRVHQEPRIAVLTTGDEVVSPGKPLAPGEVYDSNTLLITGWLRAHGYSRVLATHLSDHLEGTGKAIREALSRSDLLITAGGVSVGERDFVMKAAQNLGVREIFWRVRQRPGKPLFFGMLNEKPLLGLPGNPGSVFVCLVTHVRRVLDLLERVSSPGPHFHTGRLSEPLELTREREWWVRCRVEFSPEGEAWLIPLPHQSSHMITNLTECTALARLPEGEGVLERGSAVPWTPCAP